MTYISSDSLIRKILLPFFGGAIFFLLLLSPLLYYSFSSSFYTQYMVQNQNILSNQSMDYVQNIYAFIQWTSSLDPVFSLTEKSHMQDVKKVFHMVVVFEIIACIIFFLSLFVFIFQKKFYCIVRWFLWGSISAFVFFLLLFLAIRINFLIAFSLFHRLFFPQGNRVFDSSSMLISLFPVGFFEAIAIRTVSYTHLTLPTIYSV